MGYYTPSKADRSQPSELTVFVPQPLTPYLKPKDIPVGCVLVFMGQQMGGVMDLFPAQNVLNKKPIYGLICMMPKFDPKCIVDVRATDVRSSLPKTKLGKMLVE